MEQAYVIGDNIISSLGFTTKENIENIRAGKTGIEIYDEPKLSPEIFPASMVDSKRVEELFSGIGNSNEYTRFEKFLILSIKNASSKAGIDISGNDTLFVISTTKGNIDLLNEEKQKNFSKDRINLWAAAQEVQKFFGNPNKPVVVSNACISGVLAINTGSQFIKDGNYKNVVVAGADVISDFVVAGFQSFKSLSPTPCKPYDKDREGLTLGEGAGCVILSSENINDNNIVVSGGGCNNDANHISGPSRTGEGLFLSIKSALTEANLKSDKIGFISAHGTATNYNDEMESIAVTRHGMESTPINSFKGYWGHTLGAAGMIESVATIHSLKNNELLPTKGFENLGVTNSINVVSKLETKNLDNCLKIASGFGGCNAAVIFSKQ